MGVVGYRMKRVSERDECVSSDLSVRLWVRAIIATLTTKTMTQWLAIPTEIRLKEVPKILESQNDAVEMPAVLLDGQNVVIKQEKNDKFEMEDDEVRDNGGPYFYAMVSGFR